MRSRVLPILALLAGLALPVEGGPPVPQFLEHSSPAGVSKLHWDGTLPPGIGTLQILAPMTGGVAAGDYDADGWCDLYVTRLYAPNLLYRNRGNGSFDDVAVELGLDFSGFSTGCCWTDINNDGRLDLYLLVAGSSERNRLYVQQSDGSFSEEGVARGADVPLDFTFTRNFMSVCSGDYNLDGALDLVISEWTGNFSRNVLLENDGRGQFSDLSQLRGIPLGASYGFSPALIDADGDGWPELSLAGDYGTSQLYENLGGHFRRRTGAAGVGLDENGMGSAWGDITGDGRLEWFVSSIYDPNDTCAGGLCGWQDSGNRLYQNEPNALLFSDATDAVGVRLGGWGWGSSFFDCENDGDLDLVQTNGIVFDDTTLEDPYNDDALRLWVNDGSGSMSESAGGLGLVELGSGKGLVVFDLDNDGDQDLFVANTGANPSLWLNEASSGNWLRIRLHGHRSNRLGIGAQLHATTNDGVTRTRHMQLNSNYMSHNESVVHFGLDQHGVVDTLVIDWPASGIRQVLAGIGANQLLTIEEPCGGDVDENLMVDLSDLAVVLLNFGLVDAERGSGDLDWDQQVGLGDLALVLQTFGEDCGG